MKKNLLLLFISIFVIFAVLEVFLRITGTVQEARFMCYHPIIGNTYCPNVEGLYIHKRVLKIHLKVNSDGLLDRKYSIERERMTARIAVLGDSYTSAELVHVRNRYHEIWEQQLPKIIGMPVEVINFGLGGTGTWNQLQMYHLKAKKYKPDLTVLAFNWGNDVEDNIDRQKAGKLNPLLNEYTADSMLIRLQIARKNFNKWLWNHLAVYQFSRKSYDKLEVLIKFYLRPEYMKKPEILSTKDPVDTKSLYDDKFFMSSEGWKLTKKLIIRLRDEVKESGSKLIIIHFPYHAQLRNYPPLPIDEFNNFLKRENIPYLDLFDRYRELDEEILVKNTFLPVDGHWNKYGHQMFANFTTDFIAKELTKKIGIVPH